jgi:uncharacterized protein YycO
MITLQFSTTSHPASRLICWGTWGRHSHVDFVLPDGRLLGAVPGGVGIRPYDPAALRIERYQVDAPSTVLSAALSQRGRLYDWPGALGVGLRRDWQEDDSWFCSELVAWAFQEAGQPLLRTTDAWRITPRDLLLSPLLKEA